MNLDLWRSHGRIFAYWTCLYFSSYLWVVILLCPVFCKLKPKNLKILKAYFLVNISLVFFSPDYTVAV